MRRRGLLAGLSLLAAPAIIRTPGLLMPIRPLITKAKMAEILAAVKQGAGGEMPRFLYVQICQWHPLLSLENIPITQPGLGQAMAAITQRAIVA